MTLTERINKELFELDSPAGFKMVYKTELMKIVAEYEAEMARKLCQAGGVESTYPGDVLGERLFGY